MKILQLTDLHLFADPQQTLQGCCSYQNLQRIIDYILYHRLNHADIALITGDVSQDATASSYQLALAQLERLALPLYIIAGNHDDPATLHSVSSMSTVVKSWETCSFANWQLIPVDTVQIGQDSGLLSYSSLRQLRQQLSLVDKNKTIILVMHHHPLPVGTPLVDECMLLANQALLAVVTEYPAIKLIICGHAHGDYSLHYQQCAIEVSPASCFQWQKGTAEVAINPISGFSLFTLQTNQYHKTCYFIDAI